MADNVPLYNVPLYNVPLYNVPLYNVPLCNASPQWGHQSGLGAPEWGQDCKNLINETWSDGLAELAGLNYTMDEDNQTPTYSFLVLSIMPGYLSGTAAVQ